MKGKFATEEMAVEAKSVIDKLLDGQNWVRDVILEYDDHGYYITTKIKSRADYEASGIKVPSVVNIEGFNLKNCIMILG